MEESKSWASCPMRFWNLSLNPSPPINGLFLMSSGAKKIHPCPFISFTPPPLPFAPAGVCMQASGSVRMPSFGSDTDEAATFWWSKSFKTQTKCHPIAHHLAPALRISNESIEGIGRLFPWQWAYQKDLSSCPKARTNTHTDKVLFALFWLTLWLKFTLRWYIW